MANKYAPYDPIDYEPPEYDEVDRQALIQDDLANEENAPLTATYTHSCEQHGVWKDGEHYSMCPKCGEEDLQEISDEDFDVMMSQSDLPEPPDEAEDGETILVWELTSKELVDPEYNSLIFREPEAMAEWFQEQIEEMRDVIAEGFTLSVKTRWMTAEEVKEVFEEE